MASFRAFMTGLIDYAGLFPPAKLSLDAAMEAYAGYRRTPEAWMLGRFVIPAGRLGELSDGQLATGPPFAFVVLGRGGDSAAAWSASLDHDLAAVQTFRRRHGERAVVEQLEVRLPGDLLRADDRAGLTALLQVTAARLPGLFPYYEVPDFQPSASGESRLQLAVAAVAAGGGGLKLRCGGDGPAAYPTVAQVAGAILAAREAGIPLKATAGLHHPVRHFDATVGAVVHGFVNLFGAGLLAHVHELDRPAVEAILADTVASHFRFEAAAFSWQGLSASPATITDLRATALTTFGSCSFEEPRLDLQLLGLLRDRA